jgi:hypothetical protein
MGLPESGFPPPVAGRGIFIAAAATDAVNLNGLLIEGQGRFGGSFGIAFNSGKSLVVQNCVFRKVGWGINFYSDATTSQTPSVPNSYFADNWGDAISITKHNSGAFTAAIERVAFYGPGQSGLGVSSFDGTVDVALTDSIAAHTNYGVWIVAGSPSVINLVLTRVSVVASRSNGIDVRAVDNNATASLALTQSVVARNGLVGVLAYATNNATISVALMQSVVVGNETGVLSSGTNTTMRIAQSTVIGNGTGYSVGAGAVILSYGDNYIDGNGCNSGALGRANKQ